MIKVMCGHKGMKRGLVYTASPYFCNAFPLLFAHIPRQTSNTPRARTSRGGGA